MRELREARQASGSPAKPVENALREGLRLERVPDPCILVLFGATGDLAHRKVIPALYQLWRTNLLPHEFLVLADRPAAVRRRRPSAPRSALARAVQPRAAARRGRLALVLRADPLPPLDFDDAAGFDALADAARRRSTRSRAPAATTCSTSRPSRRSSPRSSPSSAGSGSTTSGTTAAGGGSSSRSRSATTSTRRELNREVGKVFRESQVYRIDHYLGKETVRNLLVFRFGNGIFEPIWNRRHVDHVQITVAESIGVENRGAFYEETGASATSSRTTCSNS